ncbi:hypothetical protein CYLTODRAFT_446054 [Cylindrobasidium torrendii FP15055 ss-10]|uniref:Uncharacterized protein n=1 Tax=Cylindrobasidium torrendii FP15055 ss-10 TaxID=1314674 RepID=A0A0D7B2C9_9AGAR|nr:hypothetical protein CYLTODRAFT_446054 [Cylindrobasidium torrendii FP15055 ss-10]
MPLSSSSASTGHGLYHQTSDSVHQLHDEHNHVQPAFDYSNTLNLWGLSQPHPPVFLVMPHQRGPTPQQAAQEIQRQRDLRFQQIQEENNQLRREKAEAQALAQRKVKKGRAKAPEAAAVVANAFFPSSRAVAGRSQNISDSVPPSSEAIADARAIEQAGMAVTDAENKKIMVLAKRLTLTVHPWFSHQSIFDLELEKIEEALADSHMYDNEFKAITDTELTRLLIARDTYAVLPEQYYSWMQNEDEAYTSVLHSGAGEGRSNFINRVKDGQQDIFLEAFTNVFDGREIPGHDPITQCLNKQCREHIMMMCPRAAALLSSCRTDDLLNMATGRMPLLTEKDDIAYHAFIGPIGAGRDVQTDPEATFGIGTPQWPLVFFATSDMLVTDLFDTNIFARIGRMLVWGPSHTMALRYKAGTNKVDAGGSALANKWSLKESTIGMFASIACLVVHFLLGDAQFSPAGATTGFDHEKNASNMLLLISGMLDESTSPDLPLRKVMARFDLEVFGANASPAQPACSAPTYDNIEQAVGKGRRQMIQAAIAASQGQPVRAHRPTASPQTASPVASPPRTPSPAASPLPPGSPVKVDPRQAKAQRAQKMHEILAGASQDRLRRQDNHLVAEAPLSGRLASRGGRTSTFQASASPADTEVDSDSSGDDEPVERIVRQLSLNLEEEEVDLDDDDEDEDGNMEDGDSDLPVATLPPRPVKASARKKAAPAIAAEERPVAGPSRPKPKPVKSNRTTAVAATPSQAAPKAPAKRAKKAAKPVEAAPVVASVRRSSRKAQPGL